MKGIFIIIIVFAVFIWSLLGEQDASGAPGAPEGTIAFLSNRNSKPPRQGASTTVYLIDADGNNERKWLEDPQAGFGPMAWSPDGKYVAFHIQTDFSIHIFLMDLRTGKRKNLTAHFGDHLQFSGPAWSGDGKWLALVVIPPPRDELSEVYVMDVEGKVLQNLTQRVGPDSTPSWSPDSSKIVYTSTRDKQVKIYVMDRDGRNQVSLTNHPGHDWHPQWSPDGKKVAFYSDRDGNSEIYVMNADGSNVVNLTRHPSEDRVPAWSPDGRWIAFQSTRDGNWEVYVMDANGNNQRRVTNHPGIDGHPTWVISDMPFSVKPQGKLPTVWGRIKSEKRRWMILKIVGNVGNVGNVSKSQ